MEKKIVTKTILSAGKTANNWGFAKQYTWGEVKAILQDENIILQDDDTLEIAYQEAEYCGDSSSDASYHIRVTRSREETDEEFERRKLSMEAAAKRNKEERRKTYEKLKKEFEV